LTKPSSLSGTAGESLAAAHLRRSGYEILSRNLRVGGVEIDILARRDDTLCLVEVKTRKSNAYGAPEEYVDVRKRRRLIRAGKLLLQRKAHRDHSLRFDVVAVTAGGEASRVRHIEGAFEEA